jgi:adenylyltransferase/sulfurtransferase
MAIPTALKEDRYSRQVLLPEIGPDGQGMLAKASAVVIGCGALGTHSLSLLVRAGVGSVRVVDRDVVELTNLQRQTLFSEEDIGRPKAQAAQDRLRRVNSEVEVEGVVADVTASNVTDFIRGATVVVDATDNMETRYLVNDACVRVGVPWVYGGAVGVSGMALVVSPGGPCLRCVFPKPPRPGMLPTCNTVGIINTLPGTVSSVQVTEALKIMTGKAHTPELMVIDVWAHDIQRVKVSRDPRCTSCGQGALPLRKVRG